ncbi:MAG: hypothetical protein JWO42_3561 [Chloroflexi bacterium]|nr:hypothetical protein [Chloroflexota bacterium]
MSPALDLYVATSGPYRLAFVAAQIDSIVPCPSFDANEASRPGVLGTHEGMRVVHPAWFWGDVAMRQSPHHLLVIRSGICALAVDTYRLQRFVVDPPPSVMSGSGPVYGLVNTPEGLMPVIDLACVPLA